LTSAAVCTDAPYLPFGFIVFCHAPFAESVKSIRQTHQEFVSLSTLLGSND
jgi:hypothetical protein